MAALFSKLRLGRGKTTEADAPVVISTLADNKQDATTGLPDGVTAINDHDKPQLDLPSEDAQRGVQGVQAVTLTWSKKSLVTVFILYVVASFTDQSVFCLSNLLLAWQYVAALHGQCLAIFHPVQPDPVCHERLRVSLPIDRHQHCCKCHDSGSVHPFGQDAGRLGTS